MKAAVVVANEDVQYQEVEEPQVSKGTVKIRVRYSGICGSDNSYGGVAMQAYVVKEMQKLRRSLM